MVSQSYKSNFYVEYLTFIEQISVAIACFQLAQAGVRYREHGHRQRLVHKHVEKVRYQDVVLLVVLSKLTHAPSSIGLSHGSLEALRLYAEAGNVLERRCRSLGMHYARCIRKNSDSIK